MYYVYIVGCKDGTLYTGISSDVSRRFREHVSGRGGAYTRAKRVKKLLYTEEWENRSAALKRESEIKSWRREKKLSLIEGKI
ncbi:MAG: GIY-YIG nuclease family protein [Patescibacteria group bacterium]